MTFVMLSFPQNTGENKNKQTKHNKLSNSGSLVITCHVLL